MGAAATLFGTSHAILAPWFANKTVEANTSTRGCSLAAMMVRRVPSNREFQATLIRERSGWLMTYQPEIRSSFVGDSPYWPSQFCQKDIAWRWFLASGRLLRLFYGTACRLQDQTAGTGSNLNQISIIARKFQESRILVNRVSSWILNLMGLILPFWSI